MTLLDFLHLCQRSWRSLVLIAAVGLAGGIAATIFVAPLYQAQSQLFVSVRASGDDTSQVVQGNSAAQQKVTSYVEVVRSASVLQPVIDELGLDTDVESLAERVSATSPANSVLIDVSVLDEQPKDAQRIAAAVSESLAHVVTAELERSTEGGPSLVGIKMIQPPALPTTAASPSLVKNLALGVVGALALGVAFVLLRHLLDNKVRSRADVESVTPTPILGDIALDATAKTSALIVHSDPRNPGAEAFRALRTNVQFVDLGGTRRAFTVTSALPSEGKSTTAANLALALAETGTRVALVDADLRRPRIAEMLGVEGAVGLTDLLIGRAELDDVLVPWGRGELRVLPSGSIPPNPSELLASEAMLQLVEVLTRDYDAVIIDAPPLLPVTDAAILSRLTDGALVVSAAGRATRPQLRSALETLENIGGRAMGIVLTMRRREHHSAATYYRYSSDEKGSATVTPDHGRRAADEPA
ncbi:polysaccharide biosynthesis tyrosine autokinase [Curtobacterium sp. VKM Ac-2884]|uniref:polysaccharide biosynthesis tyrosine autokinase n=1 Tax=Curtobacterium sp. VKM Ac-2884 TaxID=2783818 RepID=UPI00188A3278|nr:polysaccharide biosynthesis tyrosine autokinase [Curtobacterium sp. VKM Ac-2884]MBF4605098.1 polysaccharide biosynthesis tyrosine autokinase [Curtobacterium sp. VKM Ac-2884]